MPEVSETQMALAQDANFINRVAYVAGLQAMVVRQEAAATLHHVERDKLAQHVIANPVAWAQGLAAWEPPMERCSRTSLSSGTSLLAWSRSSRMKDRLIAAAQDAIVFTVRWIVVVVLTLGLGYGLIADYLRTREGANQGRAAVDYINKVIAEQQKAAAQRPAVQPAPNAPK